MTDGAGLPRPGTLVDGRWQLVARIGRGGTGEIWRASSVENPERRVAVKLLHRVLSTEGELVARFEREIATSMRIDHPNAVRVIGGGRTTDEQPYLVMEEIRGRPLSIVAATEAPIGAERVAAIGRQIARGLGAAHAVGVVHRDLKPENVLVTRDGGGERVVVFDFGLSLARGDAGIGASRLTARELRIGTPGYMAPEYLADGQVDERSDFYALGVVLFELASGRMPFVGPPSSVFHQQLHGEPVPLASVCAAPAWLCDAVDRLLRREPVERPVDAAAVERSLLPRTSSAPPPR
ncbi:MAG: serine/threonine-protein kinase [Myxococcota bacterium]